MKLGVPRVFKHIRHIFDHAYTRLGTSHKYTSTSRRPPFETSNHAYRLIKHAYRFVKHAYRLFTIASRRYISTVYTRVKPLVDKQLLVVKTPD